MNEHNSQTAKHAAVLLAALVLVLAGCRAFNPLPGLGLGNESPEEERIQRLMRRHSGRVEVYRDFSTVFTARAVYISDEIRRLAVDWEAKSRLLDPQEREELYGRTLRGGPGTIQVLLGFYTPDEERNNLAGEDPDWIAFLRAPDGSRSRATCYSLGEEEGKIYMRFLKWDLSWSRLYLLCFPPLSAGDPADLGWVDLVISGPDGTGEMRLKTSPPGR